MTPRKAEPGSVSGRRLYRWSLCSAAALAGALVAAPGCETPDRPPGEPPASTQAPSPQAISAPPAPAPTAPPLDDATAALVRTIDEGLQSPTTDFTPSSIKLMQMGLPGARAVVDLLDAPGRFTRRRAQRVIEGVVMMRNGWVAGRGYADDTGPERTNAVLAETGRYDPDAPVEQRRATMERWRRWLAAQKD